MVKQTIESLKEEISLKDEVIEKLRNDKAELKEKMAASLPTLSKAKNQLEEALKEIKDLQRMVSEQTISVARYKGMLEMLERLGTIPVSIYEEAYAGDISWRRQS